MLREGAERLVENDVLLQIAVGVAGDEEARCGRCRGYTAGAATWNAGLR